MTENTRFCLEELIDKALREEPLTRGEALYLLGLDRAEDIRRLFETARILRHRHFGEGIFMYGFLYFSTWCRNNCAFCNYRSSNSLCRRYRKTDSQVMNAALELADSGVHLLDLTMGEDPLYYGGEVGFEPLLHMVRTVRRRIDLPMMISPGALPDEVLQELFETGVEWYACYQETHNRKLYHQLRLNQDYDSRLRKKYKAAELGVLIEEGILAGVGETMADVAQSIEEMRKMAAHQVRVMNFIPQQGTPMQDFPEPPRIRELLIMAVLRLSFPDRLIPASLDVYGLDGLKAKLEAGANVITSLIPPRSEMVGVAQSTLGIAEGCRTVAGVTPILDELGLARAHRDDYVGWIEKERKNYLEASRNREKVPL